MKRSLSTHNNNIKFMKYNSEVRKTSSNSFFILFPSLEKQRVTALFFIAFGAKNSTTEEYFGYERK